MTTHDENAALKARLKLRRIFLANPARAAAIAYAVLMLIGAMLLTLPQVRGDGRSEPIGFIDALFTSVSAVSTTGLVTIDPGTAFNFGGELVLLILLQIGGIGYLTLMSFVFVLLRERLTHVQRTLTTSSFGLSEKTNAATFVRHVVTYTVVIETVGAIILAYLFTQAGVKEPIWQAIFHSISAFCTAGFSLFPNSLEDFKGNAPVLYVVGILS
jgi:trk system potassium uptake protein